LRHIWRDAALFSLIRSGNATNGLPTNDRFGIARDMFETTHSGSACFTGNRKAEAGVAADSHFENLLIHFRLQVSVTCMFPGDIEHQHAAQGFGRLRGGPVAPRQPVQN
jgi:hypothetical protein